MILTITKIISLYNTDKLIIVTVKCCVSFSVSTKSLNIIYMSFSSEE